jgi:hypothetical protein
MGEPIVFESVLQRKLGMDVLETRCSRIKRGRELSFCIAFDVVSGPLNSLSVD